MAKKETALVAWDKELAEAAKASADQVAGLGGGQFFSLKSGTLSFNGSPVPNNEIAVVILDHVHENVFYGSDFDSENPSGPLCYAFGRDINTMAPHESADQKVSAACKGCENNEFGSAERGKGKACKNRVRLALLPAGTLQNGKFEAFEDEDAFTTGQVGYMGLPPTSTGAFGAYVKQLAGALKRPPYGVFTKIKVVPDPKRQIAVTFELLGQVPNNLLQTMKAKHLVAGESIIFPYPKFEDTPKKAGKAEKKKKKW